MAKTIFYQTFPKFLLPKFQKTNSWIVSLFTNKIGERTNFYEAYFVTRHYYCSDCGTVEITHAKSKTNDNVYSSHTCSFCKNSNFLNLLFNHELKRVDNISFELFETDDFYHIQPYFYMPTINYEDEIVDKKVDLRGYKCDKNIYKPLYFNDNFFKEENIKYRKIDISIDEIESFFLENLKDEFKTKNLFNKNNTKA